MRSISAWYNAMSPGPRFGASANPLRSGEKVTATKKAAKRKNSASSTRACSGDIGGDGCVRSTMQLFGRWEEFNHGEHRVHGERSRSWSQFPPSVFSVARWLVAG